MARMRALFVLLLLTACAERPGPRSRSHLRPLWAGDIDTSGDAGVTGDTDVPAGADEATGGDATPQNLCGNARLDPGESCDDGSSIAECDTRHDGGDGACVPAGTCSDGYVESESTCIPESTDTHVHIYVDNFCNLSVQPAVVEVPNPQGVSFTYHNHSVDYAVDVWLSYGGGFLELETGTSWDDQFTHCLWAGRPYDAYADISISGLGVNDPYCPGHRMLIHCR
jgi:hypothetical protein